MVHHNQDPVTPFIRKSLHDAQHEQLKLRQDTREYRGKYSIPASSDMNIEQTLEIPAQISSLALNDSGQILLGSVDGSVRQYDRSIWKVTKAIRSLNGEVSSIVTIASNGQIWLACEQEVLCFSLTADDKLILSRTDAKHVLRIVEDNDVLNQLSLHSKNDRIAFGTDLGKVGVLDLATHNIIWMRTSHESICGSISFIPDRPRELVSGGYDATLLHHDFETKTLLSRRTLTNQLSSDSVSMSPPFVLCLAMSPTAALAAGTADGQLWVGLGGDKSSPGSSSQPKKSKKWGGFRSEMEILIKSAEAPIVALAFTNTSILVASTLEGSVTSYAIQSEEGTQLVERWNSKTISISKVNFLVVDGSQIFIGGVGRSGKGCLEVCSNTP